MLGGIQGNTEKIFTVLMTCFHNPYIIRVFSAHGKWEYLPEFMAVRFRVPCPRGPVSSWCIITFSHAPLCLCTYGPPTPCACCWAWDHVGSAVCPSRYSSPQTHQAPVFCELSRLPDVERGAEGEAGTAQHRASCPPGPIPHPLLLAGQTPLVVSMYPPCCPAGMFQPR